MRRLITFLFSLAVAASLFAQPQTSKVTIDGKLNDALWRLVRPQALAPTEAGVPAAMGGEIRAAMSGGYLYLGARVSEPTGRLTARSIGFDPIWEGGAEDRLAPSMRPGDLVTGDGEDFVRFVISIRGGNDWMLQVGPLGGYSVKWKQSGRTAWLASHPDQCNGFLVAAAVGRDEWSVEAAIPLKEIGSPQPSDVRVQALRNRAERPGVPEEWWTFPANETTSTVMVADLNLSAPVLRAPEVGNSKLPPVKVGYRKDLPSLYSRWEDPGWLHVRVWTLLRDEPFARAPRFPTEVKMMHNGQTLAILARCAEPGRVIAHAEQRDGLITQDDSFQVYLATSGSGYVQYAVNPLGYILDATAHQGSLRLWVPYVSWNSPVRAAAWRSRGEWFGRLDIPLSAVAQTLSNVGIPKQWRILLVRNRVARDGEPQEISELPVTQCSRAVCPARYRRMDLVDIEASQLPKPPFPPSDSGPLTAVPSRVFSAKQRKQLDLSGMLKRNVDNRIDKAVQAEKQDWDQVKTVSDWEHFRDVRLAALKAALGKFPASSPLETHVTSEYRGNGYRRENIVYQSQPGMWVTANLYLPAKPKAQMPGIIIIHSLHGPKSQFELQDMGIIWARAGCAVLNIDQVGYGARIQNYPWDRENYDSRYIMGEQLYLIGSNLMTWMVWDIERGIDLLLARPDINKKEIIILGGTAGGGDPAAVTAALDSRVAAVVPVNFGKVVGERGDWVPMRALRLSFADQFFPWFICASVAPRYFAFSSEFGWTIGHPANNESQAIDARQKSSQEEAWDRYQKVWGLYNAVDHLAETHGTGPFPGWGEAWSIAPSGRRTLYPVLARWFGIPSPFAGTKDLADYPDLHKSIVTDRRPISELAVLTPAIAAQLRMRSVHDIARDEGGAEVKAARDKLSGMSPRERRNWLKSAWAKKLGDIEPVSHPRVTLHWTKRISYAVVEAFSVESEPGIQVPFLLMFPRRYREQDDLNPAPPGILMAQSPVPVVVGVAEGGKDRFLRDRSGTVQALLESGIAVCLPDVRGTGETSPDFGHDPQGQEIELASAETMLGGTLLGKRLRDLRTVLEYLEGRPDMDSQRIGLWGDSFTPPNPAHLLIEEQPLWQIGPQIEQHAEPLGGLLALLGSLYDDHVGAVAVHGGLVSFLSMLNDSFIYVPEDVVVPGSLEIGDIADVAAAAAPRPLLMQGTVNGRDQTVSEADLKSQLRPIYEAYREAPAGALSIHAGEATDFAAWFRDQLR